MDQFKKIALAIAGTILLFVVLDFIGGIVCDKLYQDAKYGQFARQNYVLKESTDDIIIIGSSRAAHHYIPSIISDSLGMSCYNAASDGQCIYYHFGVMSSMIERGHKPKLVIYEVMNLDLQEYKGATFSLDAACDQLSPHLGEFECINSFFEQRGEFEKLKLQSKLYRYNSQLVQLLNCRFVPKDEDSGYEPINGSLPYGTEMATDYNDDCIDTEKEKCFINLIDLLKVNDIKLILAQSPYYAKTGSKGIDRAKEIAGLYNIPFYDMINESCLMKPEYFKDIMHLNHEGAKLFSSILVQELKTNEEHI